MHDMRHEPAPQALGTYPGAVQERLDTERAMQTAIRLFGEFNQLMKEGDDHQRAVEAAQRANPPLVSEP
eukprot:8660504-Pyramimonas_sp.AAC.2